MTNEPYATRIARDWNTKDDENGNVGYVLRFDVDSDYLSQFDVQQVGDDECLEYWIPAEQLDTFNDHIVGLIEVIREYREGPGGSQLLLTDDVSTPPPPTPIAQMTEDEYRRFVNMMIWLVADEAEELVEIGNSSTQILGGERIEWGPWPRADCAVLLARWLEAGLLTVHRAERQLADEEARELLSHPGTWGAFTGKAKPFVAARLKMLTGGCCRPCSC